MRTGYCNFASRNIYVKRFSNIITHKYVIEQLKCLLG